MTSRYSRVELRSDGRSELALAAEKQFGYYTCPCCRLPMARPRRNTKTDLYRRDRATVAHDVAVSLGGNPVVWVYVCMSCNHEQKRMAFDVWSGHLKRIGDPRWLPVFELSLFVMNWCAIHRVERRL